jgi:hypothetical protein
MKARLGPAIGSTSSCALDRLSSADHTSSSLIPLDPSRMRSTIVSTGSCPIGLTPDERRHTLQTVRLVSIEVVHQDLAVNVFHDEACFSGERSHVMACSFFEVAREECGAADECMTT